MGSGIVFFDSCGESIHARHQLQQSAQLEDLSEALLDFESVEDLTAWGRIYDRVGTCSTLTARRSASSPRRS